MVSGFFVGIVEWVRDLLKGVWDMLRLYVNSMANGSWLAWGLTILAVVVVVILALTGVLEAALVIAGIVLLVVGVIASIMAIIGNVQQWQADMSDYDRSKLVGRSVMDVISAILAGAGALKLGRAAQVANDVRGLEALARGGASVADLLRKGYSVEQILAVAAKSGRTVETLQGLLAEGVELRALLKAGVGVDDLLAAGATRPQLLAGGADSTALRAQIYHLVQRGEAVDDSAYTTSRHTQRQSCYARPAPRA